MNSVLPVGRRPKCRACGKELKPNFAREETGGTRLVRRYHERGRLLTASNYGVLFDGKRYYLEYEVDDVRRVFRGTYGWLGDDLFCGVNCGSQWARVVVPYLEAQGRGLVTWSSS